MAKPKMTKRVRPRSFDENPEWTEGDFERSKPLRDVDPGLAAALKRGRGRPKLKDAKVPISLRIAPNVLHAYKATGEGWQGRMAAALARGIKGL